MRCCSRSRTAEAERVQIIVWSVASDKSGKNGTNEGTHMGGKRAWPGTAAPIVQHSSRAHYDGSPINYRRLAQRIIAGRRRNVTRPIAEFDPIKRLFANRGKRQSARIPLRLRVLRLPSATMSASLAARRRPGHGGPGASFTWPEIEFGGADCGACGSALTDK